MEGMKGVRDRGDRKGGKMKVSGMISIRNTTEIKAQTLNQRKHTPNSSILKGLTAAAFLAHTEEQPHSRYYEVTYMTNCGTCRHIPEEMHAIVVCSC